MKITGDLRARVRAAFPNLQGALDEPTDQDIDDIITAIYQAPRALSESGTHLDTAELERELEGLWDKAERYDFYAKRWPLLLMEIARLRTEITWYKERSNRLAESAMNLERELHDMGVR